MGMCHDFSLNCCSYAHPDLLDHAFSQSFKLVDMGMTWLWITKPQMTKLLCAIFWTVLFVEIAAVSDAIKVVVKDVKNKWKA